MNNRQKQLTTLNVGDEFTCAYIVPRKWTENRYKLHSMGRVEKISSCQYWESVRSPEGPQEIPADHSGKWTTLGDIFRVLGRSGMRIEKI